MENPKPIPAVVTPCDSDRIIDLRRLDRAPAPQATEGEQAGGRRIPFTYAPGPISIILLKIRAMENYSTNSQRLMRQRQFYVRVKGS